MMTKALRRSLPSYLGAALAVLPALAGHPGFTTIVFLGAAALSSGITTSAFAQAPGDDDDDGDDDAGGGGGGGGGGPAPGTGEGPANIDDGENVGPDDREDCFIENATRPPWLRDCIRPRPTPVAAPAPSVPPAAAKASPNSTTGGSTPAGRTALPAPNRAPRPVTEPAEPLRSIRREIVVLNASEAQISALVARGYVVVVRSGQPVIGGTLVRFRVPDDLSTPAGLNLARQIAPGSIADFNHIYGVYRPGSGRCDTPACKQRAAIGWTPVTGACQAVATIGMIDTPVEAANPALAGQALEAVSTVAAGRAPASPLHGTAIAALLVGRSDASVPGLLGKSKLVAVSAFHTAADGEDIGDTYDVVTAVDLLVNRNVKVINSSFAGPDNRILAEAVKFASARGSRIVASVGNAGPGSPPLYPAAYDDVVAVTGVAADFRIYRQAIRGAHLDFAGPGVDVQVMSVRAEPRYETGTSFAAPFVSAALAAASAREPGKPLATIIAELQKSALDLGPQGRDPVFGWGLLQAQNVCP